MQNKKYNLIWLAFIQFEAEFGESFNNLIDIGEQNSNLEYTGAWANVLIHSTNMQEVFNTINHGLKELKFRLIFIQKIENIALLVEKKELKKSVMNEIDHMLRRKYKFMISDRIFPYIEGEE